MINNKDLLLEYLPSNFRLSVRATNICGVLHLRTLGQLSEFINEGKNFLKVKNCGIKTKDEIINFYETNKYLLYNEFSITNSNPKPKKEIITLTAFEELRFNEILKSEFLLLSVRSQNGFLNIFNNKLPSFADFSEFFIYSNHHFYEEKNIGAKSGAELSNFIERIIRSLKMTISKITSPSDEIAFQIEVETGIKITNSQILHDIINHQFNLISFLQENLRQFFGLSTVENYVLRNKLEINDQFPFKSDLTKERIRQIGKIVFSEIPTAIYAKCNHLLKYTGILKQLLDIEVIELDEFKFGSIEINTTIREKKLFSVFVIGCSLKDSLYSLSKLDKIKRPKIVHDYEVYKYIKQIRGYYLICNNILPKQTLITIYNELVKELCKRQENDRIFSLKKYYLKSSPITYETFFRAISYILLKEFRGLKMENTKIVIERNTSKTVFEYAIEALTDLGRPSHASDILSKIIEKHPNFDSTLDSLKNSITRKKKIFIYFGRASTYGLKIWEKQFKNIKGGTIRQIVEEFLNEFDRPCHISSITSYVKKYRRTNELSVLGNLKIAGIKRFKFFKNGYVGLSTKNYENKKDSKIKYTEISLDDLLMNIFGQKQISQKK